MARVDDEHITVRLKSKLAADGDINPFSIDVDVENGIVTLSGSVAKDEARVAAERLAREVEGVKRVINLIKVGEDG